MKYQVKTFRDAGLEAKWGKVNKGQPAIFLRNPNSERRHQRETWWLCDNTMFQTMKEHGTLEGFDNCTLFGDIFSVPA